MSEFERIFGAGGNVDSIINGINAFESRISAHFRSGQERYFATFKEATDWLKTNTDFFVVRCPHDDGFIAKPINPNEKFVIRIDPEKLGDYDSHSVYSACRELGGEAATTESVSRYICMLNGESSAIVIDRRPPPFSEIIASLRKIEMALYPLNPRICLIDNFGVDFGQIDGALITENSSTSIVAPRRIAEKIYRAIMCI